MICYRDRTYCIAKCTNVECSKMLTKKVKEDAEDFGLPVSFTDFSDTCTDFIKKENSDD